MKKYVCFISRKCIWHILLQLCCCIELNPLRANYIPDQSDNRDIIVPADEVGRGHRNGEHPSVCPCVRASICLSVPPGFPTIIWKSHHSIHFKFNVGICWASVQNWFAFGMTLTQFWPSSGQKITENGPKWWFPIIISKSIHIIQFKLCVYTYWVSVQ